MLDGVQARLLLQASGLLIIPIAMSLCIEAAIRIWLCVTEVMRIVSTGSAPIFMLSSDVQYLAYEATWLVLCALMLLAGWRLFFAKGYLFPMLVRSLAK